MLPAEVYRANFVAFEEIGMTIVCQIFNILYSPVQVSQSQMLCSFSLSKVLLLCILFSRILQNSYHRSL